MSEYRRLTKRVQSPYGEHKKIVVENDIDIDNMDIINCLAELEDKIEQGTLIELTNRKPLMWGKSGDTVHCQHCGKDLMGVFDGETEVIQCPKCGGFVYGCIAEDYNEAKLKELQE